MRWQMLARCAVSRNLTFDSTTLPPRSTNTRFGPFTMMSVMRVVLEQRLERAEAEDVVHQLAGQRALLARVELDAALGGDLRDQPLHIDGQPVGRHGGDRGGIEPREAAGCAAR